MKTTSLVNTKILVLASVFVLGMLPTLAFADSLVPIQYYFGSEQEQAEVGSPEQEQAEVGSPEQEQAEVGSSEQEESQDPIESVAPVFPDPIDSEKELIGEDNDPQEELAQIKAENDNLKKEIEELKQQIQNLQQIVMEQVKVMVQSLGISS